MRRGYEMEMEMERTVSPISTITDGFVVILWHCDTVILWWWCLSVDDKWCHVYIALFPDLWSTVQSGVINVNSYQRLRVVVAVVCVPSVSIPAVVLTTKFEICIHGKLVWYGNIYMKAIHDVQYNSWANRRSTVSSVTNTVTNIVTPLGTLGALGTLGVAALSGHVSAVCFVWLP